MSRPVLETLSGQLGAVAARLSPQALGTQEGLLDEAVARLRHVEALLEELAGGTDVPPETARRLRSLRETVSVHLSAAASLRLLDLDAKAAAVLRRAVESVQPAVITFVTQGKPVAVA